MKYEYLFRKHNDEKRHIIVKFDIGNNYPDEEMNDIIAWQKLKEYTGEGEEEWYLDDIKEVTK